MFGQKEYLDYVENVLGVKAVLVPEAAPAAVSSAQPEVPLLIAVEALTAYNAAEKELLQKMLAALKLEQVETKVVDRAEADGLAAGFRVDFLDQPEALRAEASENELTTWSPRRLLRQADFKKQAWSDLQKVIRFFSGQNR